MNADRKNTREQDQKMVYELDGRPSLSTAVPLGLQHVLAMFTSNLAPILIIAGVCGLSGADTVTMVQCAMFVSGLTTFIQLYPLRLGSKYQVGARLPIVMGTSFTFVPTASAVGAAGGIGAVLGGCLAGSLGVRSTIKYARHSCTRRASDPQCLAENVLNRQFYAEKPNEKWLTDVTEFKYYVGPSVHKLYLSAILDLCDRRIVSFVLRDANDSALVHETLDQALAANPDARPLFRSDRGFQYTTKVFRDKLC